MAIKRDDVYIAALKPLRQDMNAGRDLGNLTAAIEYIHAQNPDIEKGILRRTLN